MFMCQLSSEQDDSYAVSSGEADLDRKFYVPPITFIAGGEKELSLREIIRRLEVGGIHSFTREVHSRFPRMFIVKRLVWNTCI